MRGSAAERGKLRDTVRDGRHFGDAFLRPVAAEAKRRIIFAFQPRQIEAERIRAPDLQRFFADISYFEISHDDVGIGVHRVVQYHFHRGGIVFQRDFQRFRAVRAARFRVGAAGVRHVFKFVRAFYDFVRRVFKAGHRSAVLPRIQNGGFTEIAVPEKSAFGRQRIIA